MKPVWTNVHTEMMQRLSMGLIKRRQKGLDTTLIELQLKELQKKWERSVCE